MSLRDFVNSKLICEETEILKNDLNPEISSKSQFKRKPIYRIIPKSRIAKYTDTVLNFCDKYLQEHFKFFENGEEQKQDVLNKIKEYVEETVLRTGSIPTLPNSLFTTGDDAQNQEPSSVFAVSQEIYDQLANVFTLVAYRLRFVPIKWERESKLLVKDLTKEYNVRFNYELVNKIYNSVTNCVIYNSIDTFTLYLKKELKLCGVKPGDPFIEELYNRLIEMLFNESQSQSETE